jgi:hypothetical protein
VQLHSISSPRTAPASGTRLKRSACIGLFVLGLCFWVPALLRAKLGASSATENATVDAPPLSYAAAPTQINEAPAAISSAPQGACCPAAVLKSKLRVTTTILGKTRRAAIVNGRLYREGDKIIAGAELYRLAGVAEDRIELVALGPGAGTGAKRSVMLNPTPEMDRDPCGSHSTDCDPSGSH